MEEHYFNCPYCGQQISILLDLSVHSQTYIEDCEVCCRPIEIAYSVAQNHVEAFSATATEF